MAGPYSAPNGDATLVSGRLTHCEKHGEKLANCQKSCRLVTKREWLLQHNRLNTGKTSIK